MRTLEILTAQNVSIDYNLANIGERGVAYIIDLIFMGVMMLVLFTVVNYILPYKYDDLGTMITIIPVFVFYSLISDVVGNGQSMGKRIVGLKVVKINGTEVRMSDYLVRWAFRSIDIYITLGTLGIIMINSTVKSQRLGDMLSNTAVIKIKTERQVTLTNIESLKNKSTHIVRYKEVIHMNEKEMLVLKSALDEEKEYPNQAHKEALEILSELMQTRLRIQNYESSTREFLQLLINDYIVLTR